jgi:hypothetical protein
MELEQIIKRLEWLDDERRKDKIIISTLEEKIRTLEGGLPPVTQELKELHSEITRLASFTSRFDQIDSNLVQIRVDSTRAVEAIDKQRVEHDREVEKMRRTDMEAVNKSIGDVRKGLDVIPDIKKNLQLRVEEEFRLSRALEELKNLVNENQKADEESRRSQKIVEETRRQDSKRVTDLQGEMAALRKRQDEQRGKVDVSVDGLRKLDLRLNDLLAAEGERRQAQTAFIERQSLQSVERDRIWKEWQDRFEEITKQNVNFDAQMQSMESTQRAVKRSKEAFDEISQKFERRINEITEMQRLVEERFRQEWVTFKSDDQKRWTNYTLAQEEQQRESVRLVEKQNERLVLLEDITQEMKDLLHQVTDETQKRLQDLLATAHRWVEDYDRNLGRS